MEILGWFIIFASVLPLSAGYYYYVFVKLQKPYKNPNLNYSAIVTRERTIFVIGIFCALGLLHIYRDVIPQNFGVHRLLVDESCLNHRSPDPEKYKKWIILTTISSPSSKVLKLSQIPGWKLLVVGDLKTPLDWFTNNTIFLNFEIQIKLGYKVLEHLPWNSYTRKAIGYLYAIQHGAETIYDMDDAKDDYSSTNLDTFANNFILENVTRGLIANPNENYGYIKNPYVHFGQGSLFPRGYPVNLSSTYTNNYTVCRVQTPIIQQCLGNYENVQFDSTSPPIIYPKGIIAPFNSRDTVFQYDAFWALLLPPVSVPAGVSDIWRSYWAQPLLWLTGRTLAFTATRRNGYNKDFVQNFTQDEILVEEAGIKFLAEWDCNYISKSEFYKCMIDLTVAMVMHGFWGDEKIDLMKVWIADLKCVGYKEPEIKADNSGSYLCVDNFTTYTIFNPKKEKPSNGDAERSELRKFCNTSSESATNASFNLKNLTVFESTLLVITYNFPHYQNIPWMDVIYRPYFPNILYCGDGATFNDTDFAKLDTFGTFSFVHANVTMGWYWFECALRAIDMNYGVDNYVFLSDDVIYKFWETGHLDPTELWGFQFEEQLLDVTLLNQSSLVPKAFAWIWNYGPYGRVGAEKALQLIKNGAETNSILAQFVENRKQFGFSDNLVKVGTSDIFQLPRSKEAVFYEVGQIVRKSEVFLEMGLPLINTGISSPERYVPIKGIWVWNAERSNPFYYFRRVENGITFHPIKFSGLISNLTLRSEYCDFYLKYLL